MFCQWINCTKNAISVILSRLVAKNNISASEGKRAVFASVFPLISKIPETIEKNEALQEVASSLKTNLSLIEEAFSGFVKSQNVYSPPVKNASSPQKEEEISLLDFFFGILFSYFLESEKIFEMIDPKFFLEIPEKNLYSALLSAYNSKRDFSDQEFYSQQERALQERLQKACLFVDDKLCNLPASQRKTEISRITTSVGTHLIAEQIKKVSSEIKSNPSAQAIEDLQFFSGALKKFHT